VWTSPIVLFLLRRRDLGTLDLRLLLWIVLPLVFFTLSIGKQPRYILPILPPLAMLLASSIIERTREWRSLDGARFRPRRHVAMVIGASLSGAVLTTLGVLLYRARTLFIDVPDTATVIVSFVAGVAGLVVILVSISRAWRAAPAVLALSSAVCFAALPYGGLSAADEAPVRAVAGLVRQARGSNEAIGTYKVFVRNLVFYTGVRHTDLIHEEHMADWLSKNPRALIVMPAADAARLQNQGFTFEQVARREYFDDGSIRLGMMLWPDASQHRETVVVVRADREAAP
jgi:4-amino-4-deoxy-L-arabinose transferase-like glycosyltransferase